MEVALTTTASSHARRVRVWDLSIRLFHWLLVAGITLCFLTSDDDASVSAWHVRIGWVVAGLIAFRLVWGLIGGEHARFVNFVRPSQIAEHVRNLLRGSVEPSLGHNPLGAISVIVLLGLIVAAVATGVAGRGGVHEAITYALLVFIVAHVIGVVLMSLLTRDNLVSAMVTGYKDASRHPRARDADPPARLAAPAAVIAIAVAIYGANKLGLSSAPQRPELDKSTSRNVLQEAGETPSGDD